MSDTNTNFRLTFSLPCHNTDEESVPSFKARKKKIEEKIKEMKLYHEIYEICLPQDAYSFFMINPCCCYTTIVTVLIFILQIGVYLFFVVDKWTIEEIFQNAKTLDPPAVVSREIVVLQAAAIFFIPIVQNSLFKTIVKFRPICSSDIELVSPEKFAGIKFYWLAGNIMRLIENCTSIWIVLVIIERSTSTITLLKDITSLVFVSELDEKVFALAQMKTLGTRLKDLSDEVIEYKVEYKLVESETPSMISKFCHCFSVFFSFWGILALLYLHWTLSFLIPILDQTFLCQRVYIQVDDKYNADLGYISGYYRIDNKQRNYNIFTSAAYFSPSYTEERFDGDKYEKRDWSPNVVRFCAKQRFWSVSIQQKDYLDECEGKNVLLNSMTVEDDQTYDLFSLPEDFWSGQSQDGREVPTDVFIHCHDENSNELFSKEDSCDEIDFFDEVNLFMDTRKWSSKYEILRYGDGKVFEVYSLPVYINDTLDDVFDLVFFTGLRWIGTSTLNLRDFEATKTTDKNKRKNELIEYLSTDYHAMYSNYEVAFFSEPMMNKLEENNKATPTDLMLFSPKNKQNIQTRDYNRKIANKFICSICNNETNRCLYEGTCENGVCHCKHGSSGTLCQTKPLGDGFCNEYFNHFPYNFDGGDCCAKTCLNSKYACGMDKTGNFLIGFDNCKVNDHSRIGPFSKSKAPMNLIGNNIEVTTSSSGNVLALIELETKRVSVFDSIGSHWIYRDDFIGQFDDTGLGTIIRASSVGDFDIPRDSEILASATIAVMGTRRVYIYDWDQPSMNWNEQLVEMEGDYKIGKLGTFEIHNNGKLLIILKDGQITTFKRNMHHDKFKLIGKSRVMKFDYISVSKDAKLFIAADKSCVHVFSNLTLLEDHRECNFDSFHEIVNIKISPSGKTFGYIVSYKGSATLFVVKKINDQWKRSRQSYSDKYQEIETISDGGSITFSDEWKSVNGYLKRYISSDQRHAVMIIDGLFGIRNSSLLTFKTQEFCEKDESRIYFTFALDFFPHDLSWEIVQFDANETKRLMHGDLYDSAVSIRKEFCVSTKNCVGVRIIDFGMDGLNSPGYLGIAFNGSIQWSRTNSDGYSNLYPIFGDDMCKEKITEVIPWKKYNITAHKDCLTNPCRWEKVGSLINKFHHAQEEKLGIQSPISLSADGFILAMGNFSSNNVSQVNIYRFDANQNDWLSLGDAIMGKHLNGVDLSADGSNIFISSYTNDERGLNNGLITSFAYDEEGSVWSQNGEIIIPLATNSESKPFFHFSTSADGNYIAIAAPFFHGNDVCIYHRDGRNDKFQEIQCFHDDISQVDNVNFSFSDIKLSSRGFVVAISFNEGGVTDDSLIKVFNLNDGWRQQGGDIKAFGGRYDRVLISLSSNGLILAIANGSLKKIQIFEYKDDLKRWQQKGNNVDVANDSGSSRTVNIIVPNLSANGLIVTASSASQISIYHYDQQWNVWFNNRQNAPVKNDESEFWVPMAYSADLVTVAVESGTSLEVFRLHRSSCDDTDDIFDLMIEPDDFPEDIHWSLQLDDGQKVSIGFLMDQSQSTFKFCLQIHQFSYAYFSIRDTFGDGLCCKWGRGHFTVKWNGEKVIHEKDLASETSLVLPRDNLELVELYIDNISITSLSYVILNNKNVILDDREILSGQKFQKSLQLPDYDCYTFIIYDVYSSGHAIYSFTWKGEGINNRRKVRFMEKYQTGPCTQICPEGMDLLEISLVTNIYPTQIIWDVLTFDNQEILFFDSYTTPNKYSYHSICVPENECYVFAAFQLMDTSGIVQFDKIQNDTVITDEKNIFYEVALANYTIFSGPQLTNLGKLEFGKCPQLDCSHGFTLLEFDFELDNHPDEFSWQLKDSAGSILRQSENYTVQHKHYHIYHCIPLRQCTTLVLNDTGKNGGTEYMVAWGENRVIDQGDEVYAFKIIPIFCQSRG